MKPSKIKRELVKNNEFNSENYYKHLLEVVKKGIGGKGTIKPNQLAQGMLPHGGDNSTVDGQLFRGPKKHVMSTLTDIQHKAVTTTLTDVPLIFVDHNWYAVFNKKVSEISDHEIVLPFPECIFKFAYLENQPVVRAYQSSDTFKITVEVLSNDGDLDVDLIKQHMLSACLSLELDLVTIPPTAKIDMKIKKNLDFKGISYVMLPIRRSAPSDTTSKGTGSKQRLHIRRGHWRTVRGMKKRIKWYIAGDITLGMIIKDYKIDERT